MADTVETIAKQRQATPKELRKLIHGDLDWIVMKALEKDRTRRYETASALSVDVERYLSYEPVLARPPNTIYRFKKLVRKHRVPVAAAAAVLGAIVLGLVVAIIGFARARHQREIANRLSDELRQQLYVSDMNSAYQAWDQGNLGRTKDLLSRHVPRIGEEVEDLR